MATERQVRLALKHATTGCNCGEGPKECAYCRESILYDALIVARAKLVEIDAHGLLIQQGSEPGCVCSGGYLRELVRVALGKGKARRNTNGN